MFRCTKTSPGLRPRIVVSGQRESAQPIHRISGCWPVASLGKSDESSSAVFEAHLRFCASASWYVSVNRKHGQLGYFGPWHSGQSDVRSWSRQLTKRPQSASASAIGSGYRWNKSLFNQLPPLPGCSVLPHQAFRPALTNRQKNSGAYLSL
jgi:hypothetical protein